MNVDHRSGVPPASPAPAAPPRALRHARVAVAVVFFLDGMGFGNWVVRIPAVRERLGLGEGALGLALLGVAVGALIAMPLAGRLVGRRGSRPVTRVAAVAFAASLALPALMPTLPLLTLALVLLGAGNGALAVALVAAAVGPRMLPAAADAAAEGAHFTRPSRALFALGVVAFCVLFGEGAMADWSAVYLRDVTGAGPGLAAAGFATFLLAMAVGRAV